MCTCIGLPENVSLSICTVCVLCVLILHRICVAPTVCTAPYNMRADSTTTIQFDNRRHQRVLLGRAYNLGMRIGTLLLRHCWGKPGGKGKYFIFLFSFYMEFRQSGRNATIKYRYWCLNARSALTKMLGVLHQRRLFIYTRSINIGWCVTNKCMQCNLIQVKFQIWHVGSLRYIYLLKDTTWGQCNLPYHSGPGKTTNVYGIFVWPIQVWCCTRCLTLFGLSLTGVIGVHNS